VNTQATTAIVLLIVLVALAARSEWRAVTHNAAASQAVTTTNPVGEFSVTAVVGGYVMRANKKIFYCVKNRCTGIQLINPTQNKPKTAAEAAAKPAEAAATGETATPETATEADSQN
jgi:hypothetical protein